jgi:hypothetical protein
MPVNSVLTRTANFDNLEKFAQNTVARPVSKPGSLTQYIQRHKFEDTILRLCPELVLDP